MKQISSRTLAGLVAAIVFAVALGLGPFMSGTDAPDQPAAQPTAQTASAPSGKNATKSASYQFRSNRQLQEHFDKHGKAMGFADAQAYLAGANAVIGNPNSLHKLEKEDSDDVYYLQATDEIVFVSTDGYIRTYFNPGGIDYFNRQ